jgi:hypothetical protein
LFPVVLAPWYFAACYYAARYYAAMRFSFAAVLAVTAYAALVAAAIANPYKPGFSQALWALSIVALTYAALCGLFSQGARRARAAGFALGWLAYFYLYLAPGRLPSNQLGVNQAGVWLHDYVMTNSFATLAAGVVGSLLGVLAFRRGKADP